MPFSSLLTSRKTIVLVPLFLIWLVGDLGTKHWADINLGDPRHPLVFRASAEDVGQPVSALIERQLQSESPAALASALKHVVRLPAVRAFDPETRVFDRDGAMGKTRGIYLFWRGQDLPPRRLNKTARGAITYWAQSASPKLDQSALSSGVDDALAEITLRQWLKSKLRRLSEDEITQLAASGIHPLEAPNPRVGPSTLVKADDVFLLEWRRIDVMADWWKWIYAENPGAAFGFMKQVPETARDLTFFGLTLIVFFAIVVFVIRTEQRFWAVNLALVSILAGAAGNFVDRVRYGYVIDFIDMHLGFMRWPTYNVADIAITVGIIVLIGDILFNKDSPLAAPPEESKDAG
ncbi:MAG: signal peptidase II [Myxococcota bacterium]